MNKDEARKLIHPKLLTEGFIVMGDGDKMIVPITEKLVDQLAEVEFPRRKGET